MCCLSKTLFVQYLRFMCDSNTILICYSFIYRIYTINMFVIQLLSSVSISHRNVCSVHVVFQLLILLLANRKSQ